MRALDPDDPIAREPEAAADLPWFLSGTLPEPRRRAVIAALKREPQLVDALAEEIQLRRAVRAHAESVDPPPVSFESLLAMAEPGAATGRDGPAAAQGGLAAARRRRIRWTALAAAIVLALQVGTVALLLGEREPAGYRTASAPPAGDAPRFAVTFAPDARLSAVRDLLDRHDVRIVDGPKPDGAYVVAAPGPEAAAALARAQDLVWSVERVR